MTRSRPSHRIRAPGTAGDPFPLQRLSSDHVPERDRLEVVREVYGRVIVRHEIEPRIDVPFRWHSLLRPLPGIGIARNEVSALTTRRTAAQSDRDDLVMMVVR